MGWAGRSHSPQLCWNKPGFGFEEVYQLEWVNWPLPQWGCQNWWCVCVCKWYLKLTHVCMVLFTCTCLLFCLILAGMKHFTDYRCFHFCRREVTLNGVARAVGICECKPDALSPVWGIPGVDQVFKSALRHFRFIASKQKLHVTNSSCTATFFSRCYCANHAGPPSTTWLWELVEERAQQH